MNMKTESMAGIKAIVNSEPSETHSNVRRIVFVTLALWFGVILFLGARGAFVGRAGAPPLPIFFGFAIPLMMFFAAYFGWGAFRAFVLSADLRLLAAVQAWRCAGFSFLALYAHGLLPGLFAFPAGLGDMAVGAAAPWIVMDLIRQPSYAASRRHMIWNILGITDLVVAVSLGTLCSGFFPGITGNVTTSPMSQLPLVLIPAYLVPGFIMLHFIALSQARKLAHSMKSIPATNI
jgi:hypothetical protein